MNPAVYVALFLLFILFVNLVPIRWFGEMEYVFGCLKMVFIVGLIMFNVIINIRTRTFFRYYEEPWGFQSRGFTSNKGRTYSEGGAAHLAGMWSAMTTVVFSLIGFECVSVSAAETRQDVYEREEAIKISTRKISLRVIILYTLATFTVGLNVPYDDENLKDLASNSLNSGQHSAFVIAAVRNKIVGFPHFFNGFFIFSATSAGINSLYIASRLLHALAGMKHVWPRWGVVESLRWRLERTSDSGVPRAAVCLSWVFGLLGFLSVKDNVAQVSCI